MKTASVALVAGAWRRLALVVGLALLLGACSAATDSTTTEPERLTLSDLIGTWENDSGSLGVAGDGSFEILADADDRDSPSMLGFLARDGDSLIFVTGVGGECPGENGTYDGRVGDDELDLELVEDTCQLRIDLFSEPLTLTGP